MEDCEPLFYLRAAASEDILRLAELYNSNLDFLKSHLGTDRVTADFIQKELNEMAGAGFQSCVLTDSKSGQIIALCDYRLGEETYLSLLMLDGGRKGKGLGRRAYGYLEEIFRRDGARRVRIDVVDGYAGNVVGFWEKQGFLFQEYLVLNWDGHPMRARVMKKELMG
ncbi:conserved hypothetical protein [uncultured Eubacteriales bacterium]|uniref:N-acetyltransferase domain-containing protein n=1 Tax=uncultured Eubacteriales bacterium TaxID=172733 RepID=A0A212JPW6_9FIRM|nr:conserved hypothetical protein [uncultured Eubacteriales bacterium]